MSSLLIPEPWRSFLVDIDSYVTEDHYFHCLGGFVVTHLYGSVRRTSDIDFLTLVGRNNDLIEYAGIGSPLYKKFGLYLDPVGVANVPDSYEERLIEMYPSTFKNLRFFALDPYDIVLSKIERNIQRDREDVKYLATAIPLDLDTLENRYTDELRPYLGLPEREDMTLKLWIDMIQEVRKSGAT